VSSEIVQVQQLRHVYRKGKVAVDGISFSVGRGEIFGLAWSNPVTWQTDLLRYYTYPAAELRYLPIETAALVAFVVLTFWLANRKLNGTIE
jgi:hypothetical protein